MALPALVAVDENPDVLNSVEAQLIRRYASDYRIECLHDPAEAVRTLSRLKDTAVDVALVLVGQSLSDASRVELLGQVRRLYPHAKRVLLVAPNPWSDARTSQVIRASMALGRIDFYMVRPSLSRDEVFHAGVSDFLLDWARERSLVPETVHIVGEEWSGRAYELRETFASCAVPHAFCLADSEQGVNYY